MQFRLFRRHSRAGFRRRLQIRRVVECLEERYLLSAGFAQVNLASDLPGLARNTNPVLTNPWGISFSPTGPFWFSDNVSGVSNLLNGLGQPLPLVVTIPSTPGSLGTPTGTVFNGTSGFAISENGVTAPARFLFATEDGKIAGWSDLVDVNQALVAVDNSSSGASYTGLALATNAAGQSFLYAANFARGTIDVFNQNFQPVSLPGRFHDPNLPAGAAPFNIQEINNQLYVTYAWQTASGDNANGPGLGLVDVFDTSGNFIRRLASGGALNSPWGLALAPAGFGSYGGDLLVGNNGDGRINVYNAASGAYLGTLADDRGNPIAIPNLWGLTFGNGHLGGASGTLFFTAGLNDEQDGLFGALQAPGQHGATTEGPGAFDPNAPGETGDYPLPPGSGPALSNLLGRSTATSDLLPLADSSLLLIPTLSSPSVTTGEGVPQDGAPSLSGATSFVVIPDLSIALPVKADANSLLASPSFNGRADLNQYLNVEVGTADAPSPAPATASAQLSSVRVESADPNGSIELSAVDAFFAQFEFYASLLTLSSP